MVGDGKKGLLVRSKGSKAGLIARCWPNPEMAQEGWAQKEFVKR